MMLADRKSCTGCNTCGNICPTSAISIAADKNTGFFYPEINMNLCVDCGRCYAACPILHPPKIDIQPTTQVFAAYAKDDSLRNLSSSGAVFPILAQSILELDGIVYGAEFAQDHSVKHSCITEIKGLHRLQGSKYTQSLISSQLFQEVQKHLKTGRLVLFSGTSCQIAGLLSFLGKDYTNLYCIDLICKGVPSPLIWQKYLYTYFPHNEITYINFKDKSIGWNRFCVRIDCGKHSSKLMGADNAFMKGYFQNLFLRDSCTNCQYKTVKRQSDFTLADAWGIETFAPELDDNKGCSTVLIHTIKGAALWEKVLPRLVTKSVEVDMALARNPYACGNVSIHRLNRLFFLLQRKLFRFTLFLFCNNIWGRLLRWGKLLFRRKSQ